MSLWMAWWTCAHPAAALRSESRRVLSTTVVQMRLYQGCVESKRRARYVRWQRDACPCVHGQLVGGVVCVVCVESPRKALSMLVANDPVRHRLNQAPLVMRVWVQGVQQMLPTISLY